ncbi:MAG: transcriptional regulator NrdR [Candidatus Daviesbacteria bacterium]
MRCPFCSSTIHRVVDKRAVASSEEIRRRRECLKCLKRFTTYEKIANLELVVIKKDGRKEVFDREKLKAGIMKALEKRPAWDRAKDLADKIEMKFRKTGGREITSKAIGKTVLSELKKLDIIAYLRFASVYRQFENPEDFTKELTTLEKIS